MAVSKEFITEGRYLCGNGDTVTVSKVVQGDNSHFIIYTENYEKVGNIEFENIGISENVKFDCKNSEGYQILGGRLEITREGFSFHCEQDIIDGYFWQLKNINIYTIITK